MGVCCGLLAEGGAAVLTAAARRAYSVSMGVSGSLPHSDQEPG